MNIDANLKLSYYKRIADLCPEHDVYLVQHISSKQIYVQKEIALYNKDIYSYLLEHPQPNTPIIYEVIEMDSSLIIIEEYIQGYNLQNYVETKGSLPIDQVTSILTDLCSILEPFHSMNPPIIHRDIKASNVILSNSGQIYLIDFNAAKYASAESKNDTILLGTQGYAAPEQYGFGSSNIQTDIYALGILANFLLYGSLDKPAKPASDLDKIIDKCTQLNPKDRYSSILDLRNELSPSKTLDRNYAIPGFRTHNTKHIIGALAYYILVIALSLTLHVQNAHSTAEVILYRIVTFVLLIGIFFICNDYLGLRRLMPFNNSTNRSKRTYGLIIGNIIFTFILFSLFTILVSLLQL